MNKRIHMNEVESVLATLNASHLVNDLTHHGYGSSLYIELHKENGATLYNVVDFLLIE